MTQSVEVGFETSLALSQRQDHSDSKARCAQACSASVGTGVQDAWGTLTDAWKRHASKGHALQACLAMSNVRCRHLKTDSTAKRALASRNPSSWLERAFACVALQKETSESFTASRAPFATNAPPPLCSSNMRPSAERMPFSLSLKLSKSCQQNEWTSMA
eukprot:6173634-Pleurochrysis_carterae.AAC.3